MIRSAIDSPTPTERAPRVRRTGRRSRRAACRRAAVRSRPCRSRRSCRRSCRPRPTRRRARAAIERVLVRLGARLARRPERAAALIAHLGAQRRARARPAPGGRDGSGRSSGLHSVRLSGELFDLAEDRAALAVSRSRTSCTASSSSGSRPDEPLDDLRCRQRVVARDRERRAPVGRRVDRCACVDRSGVRDRVAVVGGRRRPGCRRRGRSRRGGRRGRRRGSESSAPERVGAAAWVAGARMPVDTEQSFGAAARVGDRPSDPLRTTGGPNAIATWPRLRAVVTRCCTSSWRRSTSARPRATNMSTNVGRGVLQEQADADGRVEQQLERAFDPIGILGHAAVSVDGVLGVGRGLAARRAESTERVRADERRCARRRDRRDPEHASVTHSP